MVTIDPAIISRLAAVADQYNTTTAALIDRVLRRALEQLEAGSALQSEFETLTLSLGPVVQFWLLDGEQPSAELDAHSGSVRLTPTDMEPIREEASRPQDNGSA
ncbi:MAG: hypothetical protein ACFB51_04925 [Anaerolineae bacterium]